MDKLDLIPPSSIFVYKGQPREEIPEDSTGVVASDVENIEAKVFENVVQLQFLTLRGSVKCIGERAFYQCMSLSVVNLNEGLIEICTEAFAGCLELTSVGIPSTVEIIGSAAFDFCTSLAQVQFAKQSRLAAIHNSVFRGCRSLTKMSLPKSVKTIGERAFCECFALQELDLPDGLVSIQGYEAFAHCASLRYLRVPNTVRSIYSCAFEYCHSIVSVEFPSDGLLTSIGTGSFRDCTSLEHVVIPKSVERISESVFEKCVSLHDVKLHEGLTSIGKNAFARTNLETLDVPSTVEFIGDDAFKRCESLVRIKFAPQGLREISNGTFDGCSSLISFSVPQTVTVIGERAFLGCYSLADVHFDEGLEVIKRAAFSLCTSLSTVALPLSLKYLRELAFSRCNELMTVEIPSRSTVWIDARCFVACSELVNISIPACTSESLAQDVSFGDLLTVNTNTHTLTNRYDDLPVHDSCYHSSTTSLDDLNKAIRSSSSTNNDLEDAFGLTPFHVLGAAANPTAGMLETLLNHYNVYVLEHKDKFGNTMLDYLLRNGSSEALSLVQMVLQKTVVKRISGIGVEKWISEISSLVDTVQAEGRSETKHKCVHDSIEYFGYCMRIELTSIVELALWKWRMVASQGEDPNVKVDRFSCRLQSCSDLVLENVVKYLWLDEPSKVDIGLSMFPLCKPTGVG